MRIEDIAKRAGVSRSTVSRVLNNAEDVSEATRKRVHSIIAELGYQPNFAARMLAAHRNRVVGIVIRSRIDTAFDTSVYLPTLLQGVSDVISSSDYLSIIWMGAEVDADDRFQERILSTSIVDGLIVASSPRDDPFIHRLLVSNIPFVMVEKPFEQTNRIHYVSVSNQQSTKELIHHLLNVGRRRIGIVVENHDNSDFSERLIGYRHALLEAGLPYDEEIVATNTNEITKLVEHGIDAAFVTNDRAAIRVMTMLQNRGIDVPADIAVVGFDDLPGVTATQPSLTTVRQPVYEKGRTAAKLLIDVIEGQVQDIQHIELPTKLIIRDSCGYTRN